MVSLYRKWYILRCMHIADYVKQSTSTQGVPVKVKSKRVLAAAAGLLRR
jgi:capsule polysaccharide export protein KpsC/LpsZ